jgi:hypothetical protein
VSNGIPIVEVAGNSGQLRPTQRARAREGQLSEVLGTWRAYTDQRRLAIRTSEFSLACGILGVTPANPYRIPACRNGVAPGRVSCRDGSVELRTRPRHDLRAAHARNQRRVLDADRDVARGLYCRQADACVAPLPSGLVRIGDLKTLSRQVGFPCTDWDTSSS